MDDVLGCQPSTCCDHRLPCGQSPNLAHDLAALGEDRGTARAMNCAVHATTPKKRRVCGIHDRVGGFFGDVSRTVDFNCLHMVEQ
jgi:hypothetical protein